MAGIRDGTSHPGEVSATQLWRRTKGATERRLRQAVVYPRVLPVVSDAGGPRLSIWGSPKQVRIK